MQAVVVAHGTWETTEYSNETEEEKKTAAELHMWQLICIHEAEAWIMQQRTNEQKKKNLKMLQKSHERLKIKCRLSRFVSLARFLFGVRWLGRRFAEVEKL